MVRKKVYDIGAHFSSEVHGMFLHPKSTIRRIAREQLTDADIWVPVLVVLCAGVLTAFGRHLWLVPFTNTFSEAILLSLSFTFDLFWKPTLYLISVGFATIIFHFIGCVISGRDLTDLNKLHRSFKLIGLSMAPAFLNIFPFFYLFTGYWILVLLFWSMREIHGTTDKGALIITFPYLFSLVLGTLSTFGLL